MMTLMLTSVWEALVIDWNGIFLHVKIQDGKKLYVKIPEGIETFYSDNKVVLLNGTPYRLKHGAEILERFDESL